MDTYEAKVYCEACGHTWILKADKKFLDISDKVNAWIDKMNKEHDKIHEEEGIE